MRKHLRDYTTLLLIAGAVILLDQLSKAAVRQFLMPGEIYRPDLWISLFARIIHLQNPGALNGIFPGFNRLLVLFPVVVVLVIMYFFPRIPGREWLLRLAAGLYLGGAFGNLIDRLGLGYVTDFISIGFFPVFNIADAAVFFGIVALAVGAWQHEQAKKIPPAELSAE